MLLKKEVQKLYSQYALKNGYKEIPPDIITFVTDEFYLGKVTNNGKGIYKYWLEMLVRIYPTPFPEINKIKFNTPETYSYIILNSSAIGTGKTFFSHISLLYDLAHVLCLENPQEFYKLAKSTKIEFIVSNSNKENSESINLALLYGMIRNSPFFLSKLNDKNKSTMFINNVDLIAVSPLRRSITGRAIFSVVADELNRHSSIRKAKEYITELINRLPSRFLSTKNNRKFVPGHIHFISSADDDQSIIESIKSTLQNSDF